MEGHTICTAHISAKMGLGYKILIGFWALVTVVILFYWLLAYNDSGVEFFGLGFKYNSGSKRDMSVISTAIVGGALLTISWALIYGFKKTVYERSEASYLGLVNEGLSYGSKYSESQRTIITGDRIQDISIRYAFYDKMTGGKTILVHTARGVFKFHWVHNAEEFVEQVRKWMRGEIRLTEKTTSSDNSEYWTCAKCGSKNFKAFVKTCSCGMSLEDSDKMHLTKAKAVESKPQEPPKSSPTVVVEPIPTAEKKADNVTKAPEPTAKPVEIKKASPVAENTVQPQNNAVKEEQAIVFCHKCGTKATGESMFCHKCGTKLNWDGKK